MTSRERVLAAIAGETPDRTPRDFWAEKAALNRILADAGHSDEERLLADLGIDLRHLNAVEPREREIAPGLFQNHWGERYVYRQTAWGPLREDTKGALADARSLDDLETFPWPSPDDLDRSGLAEACRRHDDRAIVYGFADVWERPALVRGWEEWFADLVERPEWAHRLARRFTDFYKEDYAKAAEATGGRIDLYFLISDLAGQRGPLISPSMFREFVEPYLREMIDRIHEIGGLVLYHSCGSVARLIPDLIRMGVDVLDPIQPAGPEMAPERLAAEFGGRLAFHGGIDMQRLLPLGTPEEVRAEARRYREALGPRYIIAPAHFFLPDIPPANVRAMYEE
jgi:uroporphyrinogen decarboxylase